MVNIALVGWGMSAKTFHLPFILANPEFNLVGVVTSKQDQFTQQYPNTRAFSSIGELIQSANPDVVVLATPNHLHFSQAIEVIKSGCHVVIDKPFVTSVSDGLKLIDTAKVCQKQLFVYHNRRWDGDFLSLQTALQDGDLGQIKIAHLNFDRFRPTPKVRWRESAIEGAGIWFDLGPHLVDQALQLFGRPYAVQSRMVGIREGAVAIDYAHVTLCYETKDVVLRTSPFTADPMLRYQIETDLGTWRKYGLDPQEDYLKQGATFDNEGYIQNLPSEEAIWSTLTEQKTQPLKSGCYMAFYQALANSLLRNNVFPVTIQQALDVAVVIEAAKNSENLQSRYNIVWKDIQSL